MKLFITNKKEFEKNFDRTDCCPKGFCQRKCLTTKEIHQKTFNQLSNKINIEGCIPLLILQNYDFGEGEAIFNFVAVKGDIYF